MSRMVSDRPVHLAAEPRSAWEMANRLAQPNDLICVTGSFFIAAEILVQTLVFSLLTSIYIGLATEKADHH